MAVGILLVTHPGVGASMRAVATRLLGRLPLRVELFEVGFDTDFEQLLPEASGALRALDEGEGVLLMTDLFGASPSNFAARLGSLGIETRRMSGLNLPMLVRALNYADLPLEPLADAASAGGKLGVMRDHG
ncbi:PTS sugar transporter subunit IIA [Pseudomarimonas salicorniae]|uniref:PTS fructose IIA subunit family protein n=1 Tax=Pseudomarimonas salicorniae TaxID=2933270 RepID=A0ABT0GIP4_9GAMM|nr:PTS fructose IIA subunit family protein [Lysobacter sp. CAU 1642]MCK7593865.1 PTS fructose IIA subunit family protein [Lysobacter sp. CAU 1642]